MKIYFAIGIVFLILLVVLTVASGGSLFLIFLDILMTLMTVFLIYGVVIGGIEKRFSGEEDEHIRSDRGSFSERISYGIKRFRDRTFYKFRERE